MTRTRRATAPTVPLPERIRAAIAQDWHTLAALDDLTGLRGSKARAAVHEALREIKASGATVEESMALGGVAVRLVETAGQKERDHATRDGDGDRSGGSVCVGDESAAREAVADEPRLPGAGAYPVAPQGDAPPPMGIALGGATSPGVVVSKSGPTSRCAVCDAQYRAHDIIDLGHPFTPKPRGRPRVAESGTPAHYRATHERAPRKATAVPIPSAAPAILPRAKQRKTPGPIVDVDGGRVERAGDAEPVREPWPPCVDCGEPDSGTCPEGRCRDCDLEHIFTTGSCRECHTFLMREEMGAPPLAEQHVKGCSLATSDDWGVRTEAEYAATRTARYGWAPEPKRGCVQDVPPVQGQPIAIAPSRPPERCHPPTCHADSIHEPARVRQFALPLCEAHRAWVERAGGTLAAG